MSIAEQIRQESDARESARRQRGAEAYRALVKATAAGGKPPAFEKIEQTAAAAGKSVQDFASDVEKQERRVATAARFQKIPDKRARRAELQQALDAHNAKLDEAIERHRQACEPLVSEANELDRAIDAADALKRELTATAGPDVVAAIDAAGAEHQQADAAVRQARQEIEIARGNGSEQLLERHAGKPGFDHQHHQRIVAAAKAAEAALPGLEQDLVDAEAKYHAAQAQQLEP